MDYVVENFRSYRTNTRLPLFSKTYKAKARFKERPKGGTVLLVFILRPELVPSVPAFSFNHRSHARRHALDELGTFVS